MRIQFALSGHAPIGATEIERARARVISHYARYGLLNVRCDQHGRDVLVTLTPFQDGSHRFHEHLDFCCEEFSDHWYRDQAAPFAGQVWSGIERPSALRISRFRIEPRPADDPVKDVRGLEFAILADGREIERPSWFATDLNEWDLSLTYGGSYFILTCTCGNPGCAGINIPIQIEHSDEFVEWRIIEPRQALWRFHRPDYLEARGRLLDDVRRLTGPAGLSRVEMVPRENRHFFELHGLP